MSDQLFRLRAEIAGHLEQIGRLFKAPRITIVIRAPGLADGDIIMTDDDLGVVITAIERLRAKPSRVIPADQ